MATIVIGDIHGNAAALTRLLRSIEVSNVDTIVFLGDYIDRGRDARGCIEAILTLRESSPAQVVCLQGNHEEWFLRTLTDYSRHSWLLGMEAFDTIQSYSPEAASALRSACRSAGPSLYLGTCELPYQAFFDAMPDSHRTFFLELAFAHESVDCLCAHAGLDPTIPELSAQPAAALIWGHLGFPSEYAGVLPVVYGHWNRSVLGAHGWPTPYVVGNTICVDTSEYGVVTAIRMPDRSVFQSSEHDTRVSQMSL